MAKLSSALAFTSLIFALFLGGCDNPRRGAPATEASASAGVTAEGDSGIIEGTINGGGGRGMKCKVNGTETLESLDLFEARALGLKLLPVPASEDEALDLAVKLLAKHIKSPDLQDSSKLEKALKSELQNKWLTKIRYLDGGSSLRMIDDSHEVIKQSGCEPVQIAVYYESTILIDKKLWDQLDNLSKAAVWMHELIYQTERESGRTNSISTRILVGQMFSTAGSRPRMDGVPTDAKLHLQCGLWDDRLPMGSAYAFASKTEGQPATELVFEELPNTTAIMRRSAVFPGMKLTDLISPVEGQSFDAFIEVDSLNEDREVRIEGTKERSLTLTFSSRKDGKLNVLKMECSGEGGSLPESTTEKTKSDVVPIGPPKTPKEVELKSRFDGVGNYEETATYSFRFMTHDVEITRNNWDILFEARKDFDVDRFDVNTVTDDDSFIFDIKSAKGKCEAVDPCEIEKHLKFVKENLGQKDKHRGDNRTAPVAQGNCYLVASQDRDGSVKALFEVKEHVKSVSAVIHKIKVLNSASASKCEGQ